MKSRTMIINLPLTDLEFSAPARAGTDPQTNPGIGLFFRTASELKHYNRFRTHRSLNKDAPVSRSVQRTGVIRSGAILGGIHHHYGRI